MPSTSTSYWPVVWLMKAESLYAQMSGVIGHLTSALSVCPCRSSDWMMLLIQLETNPVRHLIPWGFTVLKSNSCGETENTEVLHEDEGEREKPLKQISANRKSLFGFQRVLQLRSDEITMQFTSFPNACALSRSLSHTHTFLFSLSLSPLLPLSLSLFSALSPFQFNLVCFYCHD